MVCEHEFPSYLGHRRTQSGGRAYKQHCQGGERGGRGKWAREKPGGGGIKNGRHDGGFAPNDELGPPQRVPRAPAIEGSRLAQWGPHVAK
jgi:hypothetical protein